MRSSVQPVQLILVALVCSLGCDAKHSEDEPVAAPKQVHCGTVTSAQLADVIELRGTIAPLPDRHAEVAAQVSGRILHVQVREGDRVKAGQVVAQIDTTPFLDQVHEADAALARVSAERKNAETTLTRMQRVFDQGIAARQEVDDAAARAASAQASEAEAAAVARRAHLQIERATVQSPLAGVVLRVMKRSGELVDGTPATAIVEVGDPSQLELVADAPAQDIMRVVRGNRASLTLSALPGVALDASVSAVAPAVDRTTGLGVVRVAITPGQTPMPPIGTYGSAQVQTGRVRSAAVVPVEALRNPADNDAELILCGPNAVGHVRKVVRGVDHAGMAEIVSGVRPGESIVLDPVVGISDGDRLRVVP
jgi:multidrug efflux system membrane fusion protein